MTKHKGLSAVWLDAINKAENSLIQDPGLGPVHTDVKPLWDLVQDLTKGVEVELDEPLMDEPEGINIWLDDIRDPAKYGYPDALWINNSQDFKEYMLSALDKRINIKEIHFDNDLGELSDGEGYDCFVTVENLLHSGELNGLRQVYVHSSNPSAVHKFMLAARSLKHNFGIDMIRKQY